MSQIKRTDTKPEKILRKALWAAGLRYRLKNKLPGKPDLVFPSAKVAVFVDGCFWHGCPEHMTWPKTNQEFWRQKIERNIERDKKVRKLIHECGWKCIRIWEHQINSSPNTVVLEIKYVLNN